MLRTLGIFGAAIVVIGLLSSTAKALVFRLSGADMPCAGSITWGWDASVPDGDVWEGDNWEFSVNLVNLGGVDKIQVIGFHKSKCHAIDVVMQDIPANWADTGFKNIPAAQSGSTNLGTIWVTHPTTDGVHSDGYEFIIKRNADFTNEIIIGVEHVAAVPLIPTLTEWGTAILLALLAVAGSVYIHRRMRRGAAAT